MELHAKNPKDPLIIEVKWGDYFSGVSGKGFINITEIAGAAGVRKTDSWFDTASGQTYRETYTDMPINQARKVCKFLIKYVNPALWELIDEEFSGNEKLYKVWRAEVDKVEVR